jgi:hypothetical protein
LIDVLAVDKRAWTNGWCSTRERWTKHGPFLCSSGNF